MKVMRTLIATGLLLMTVIVHAAIPDMKFRRLDARDGLSNTQVNCIFRDSRGQVWTKNMGGARSEERPIISGVRVMDGPAKPVPDVLELENAENHFSVLLASNSGEVHNRTRFAYRLMGLNGQWLYTEENNSNATYTGLHPGSYTFCVRTLNNDGTLGEEECRLDIRIAAPWYRSWWMWAVYIAVIAVFVVGQYRRNREKLRLERLKLQQENSHRLDEQRQKFYDTISDELRQPFHDTFESLNAMMKRETDEQRYELQQQVFGHLEELLEQVNTMVEKNHGKAKLEPQIREVEIINMDEKLVRDATNYVEENLDNSDISVETMAEALAMSRVHLYKKLTAVTDLTPSEFIRQIRLRHAEQLLRKSQMTVAEVAYKVGFNNPRYFSKYFKEMYGMMPSEYKNNAE